MLWEAQFLQSLQTIRTPFLDAAMGFFSMLGYHGIFCICLGILLLVIPRTRATGWQVLLSILITFIIANLILKNVVSRVRPYDAYPYIQALIEKPHDTSFPSGHTALAFTTAAAIFLNHKKTGILALVIASLVAFSRLYNCVHYPTDVLAGIVVGVLVAVLVHYLVYPACEKGFRRLRRPKAW